MYHRDLSDRLISLHARRSETPSIGVRDLATVEENQFRKRQVESRQENLSVWVRQSTDRF